ncbi:hypothetical protein [uncultured Novosphingobium sp.]|uniref:hypothetical protein n=1 Tax=uncultured Novosphingobium sp. TaxID=292277 RepID=UPI003749452D
MANAHKGYVPLKLDGDREFTLVFDHEGLIEAESAYGKPLHQVLADASTGFMGATRALLYGAMRRFHADLTLGDVSTLLFENADAIGAALSQAYDAAMPKPGASTEGKAARPRGKTSGANGAKPA